MLFSYKRYVRGSLNVRRLVSPLAANHFMDRKESGGTIEFSSNSLAKRRADRQTDRHGSFISSSW